MKWFTQCSYSILIHVYIHAMSCVSRMYKVFVIIEKIMFAIRWLDTIQIVG